MKMHVSYILELRSIFTFMPVFLDVPVGSFRSVWRVLPFKPKFGEYVSYYIKCSSSIKIEFSDLDRKKTLRNESKFGGYLGG